MNEKPKIFIVRQALDRKTYLQLKKFYTDEEIRLDLADVGLEGTERNLFNRLQGDELEKDW